MIAEALERIEKTKKEKLTYLDLKGLSLEQIPQEILEVPWIGALSLSDNKLCDISLLSGMKNLHKLALTNNQIEDISVLQALDKLRFIFLAHNKIKDIRHINSQSRLKKLVLHDNEISSLPSLEKFRLLAYLDVSNNPLQPPNTKTIREILPVLKIYKF